MTHRPFLALESWLPMRRMILVALSSLVLHGCALAQSDAATFKVDVRSAFVWGDETTSGAKSWSIKDPLTGADVLKLSHEGVELSSRMGFEKLHPQKAVELIAFTTTIVNNTQTKLSVEAGGISVDGQLASLLSVGASRKTQKSKFTNRTDIVESGNLYCFRSGFLSSENFLSGIGPPPTLIVDPRESLTVSGVIQDPRHYSMLCSVDGCFPKGLIRYAIRVGSHEYVFIWPGRSIVNCGRY
jgi:hypothetical protein